MRAMFPPDVENELTEAFFAGRTGYFVEVGANDPQYLSWCGGAAPRSTRSPAPRRATPAGP
jgi:hypothetical protein